MEPSKIEKTYQEIFSQLCEQYEGKTFIQPILEQLSRHGYCSFSKMNEIGKSVSTLLENVGIHHEFLDLNETTYYIVIKKKRNTYPEKERTSPSFDLMGK